MKTLANSSVLRNLWLRSPVDRLNDWREFRIELTNNYNKSEPGEALNYISQWWEFAPIVNLTLDPFDYTKWPSIWEIIYSGECCKYSKGLAMAYNMYYLDQELDIKICRINNIEYNDVCLIAIINSEFVCNYENRIVNVRDIFDKISIREMWDIKNILSNKK